jgi:phage terminase large subunit-like protein
VSTIDEWLSGDLREDVVGAVEQGASKLEDYLIVAISSEGTVRNGSGDTIKMELADILKGEYLAPHVSIWHYKLDEIEEVNDPSMWIKANPNLGATVSYETYHLDVERAEKAPASRNDILANDSVFLWRDTHISLHMKRRFLIVFENFGECPALWERTSHKATTSVPLLFCSLLVVRKFGVKTRSYITEVTLMKLPAAMRQKYEEFINEGSLHVMPGTVLDMMEVYDDLDKFIIESEYDTRALGFDPYNAKEFVERWINENGPMPLRKLSKEPRLNRYLLVN